MCIGTAASGRTADPRAVTLSMPRKWQDAKMNDRSIAFARQLTRWSTARQRPAATFYKGFEPRRHGVVSRQVICLYRDTRSAESRAKCRESGAGRSRLRLQRVRLGRRRVYDGAMAAKREVLRHTCSMPTPPIQTSTSMTIRSAKPLKAFEGRLYDRGATFSRAYAHTDAVELGRRAMRTCSFYAAGSADGTYRQAADRPLYREPVAPGSSGLVL